MAKRTNSPRYVFETAGALTSQIEAITNEKVSTREYTLGGLLEMFARVHLVHLDDVAVREADDGLYLYTSEDEADSDDTGAYAQAIAKRRSA